MKKISGLLICIFLFISTFPQKKQLAVDEPFRSRSFYPETLYDLQWKKNSYDYTYNTGKYLVKGNAGSDVRDTILSLEKLNGFLKMSNKEPQGYFPGITWENDDEFAFPVANDLCLLNYKSGQIMILNTLDSLAENNDIEYHHYKTAYTIGNNLFIAANGKQLAVTSDTCNGIVNGQKVHRNEFGIDKGTFWSPSGNKLAFYRMDETMVTDYPLVDIDNRIATLKNIKYPMAGMQSHHVTVGVFDPVKGTTAWLQTGEPQDQYLTNITWSPDEKYIYIAVLNRGQDHLKLNRYSADNGNFDITIFEEKDDKYVEPMHGPYFLKNDPDKFIWFSNRDGFNHLYLYSTDGKLLQQVTKGKWSVCDIHGYDDKKNLLFITATKDSPLEQNLYSVSLSGGRMNKLAEAGGMHYPVLSYDRRYIIDSYSNIHTPSQYCLTESSGKQVRTIFTSSDPTKKYLFGETQIFTIRAEDSTELYCRLIKPPGFNPAMQYPVIIYVYGGPHSQLISNSWLAGAGFYLNYLASEGYLVFTLDNRGTSNRGIKFEQAIFRNLGTAEVEDQMQGVKYLKSLPYVNADRIGVYGWSYGGFITLSLLLKNPGVFKTGVAGGPVIDWKYYEVMYGERYMDTPEDNPEGYESASLLNYVENLKSKLLIIHGSLDQTVVWQHSLAFMKKCVETGKFPDYFLYPGHEHNVSGKDRLHLYKLIDNYFKEHL